MATKTEKQQAMFSMIELWKNSGQSQHQFCKAKRLAYSGFHYWYDPIGERGGGEFYAFALEALHLPVDGQVVGVFVDDDLCQQARARYTFVDGA